MMNYKLRNLLIAAFFNIFLCQTLYLHADYQYSCRRLRVISEQESWLDASSNVSAGLEPRSIEEIIGSLERHSYYWGFLSMTAKAEVEQRISDLNLDTFPDGLVEWIHSNMRGSITGDFKGETVADIRDSTASIILKGSYIWGFKKEGPNQESAVPSDFDMVIILKDSDVYKSKGHDINPAGRKFLFGSNPRAPEKMSIRIIGENRIQQAMNHYYNGWSDIDEATKIEDLEIFKTIASNIGAGITISGSEFAADEMPLNIWHLSIKDIISNVRFLAEGLVKSSLTTEEYQEYLELGKQHVLTHNEKEKYDALGRRLQEERYYHLKLMRRILEANTRIQYFQENVLKEDLIPVYTFSIGEATTNILNLVIGRGIDEETESFFFNHNVFRWGIIGTLNHMIGWLDALESRMEEKGVEILNTDEIEPIDLKQFPRAETTP